MKQKINLRLLGISILAVIATTLSVMFIYYGLFQRQVRSDLHMEAEVLKATGFFQQEYSPETTPETAEAELEQLFSDVEDLRVTWIDSDGTVLFDNDNSAVQLENHSDRPEVRDALENGEGESVRKSDTMDMNTYYYAVLLEDGTILRVSVEARNIFSMFISVFPAIILIVIVILLICAVLARVLTKQLLAPIDQLADNMEDSSIIPVYRELIPFVNTIRAQHENILAAARSRQDFTANVSHELKTPLTAISGYAELIENHMVDAEQETQFAQQIHRHADRLVTLINDIIELSELDSNQQLTVEEMDLFETAQSCVELLKVNASKKNIRIDLMGEPCMIRGNRSMIAELIDNLCQNAIRYSNEGARVTVSVWLVHDTPILTVSDTGIGIPKDQQERVFERFYRVDKSRSRETGGTGLGLAIVKHIVELHNATIQLESEVGKGTTVKVIF